MLVQFLLARRQADVASINDHVADIGQIERLAADYWLSPGAQSAEAEFAAAARLKGALGVLAVFRDAAAPRIFAARIEGYLRLDAGLYDAVTGGDFEHPGRAPDPARAIEVINACHALRGLLRSQRQRLFGAF